MFLKNQLRAVSALALATGLMAPAAYATESGTRITNTVTVNFSVGGVSQDEESDTTGFVVDRKIDMQVISQASIPDGRPKQTARELVYKVVNEGNDAQPFDIDVSLTKVTGGVNSLFDALVLDTNTDTLEANEYRIYISADDTFDGGDTVYDPAGLVTAATPASFGTAADADEFHVIIRMNIPSTAENDDIVRFSVRATAMNDAEDGAMVELLSQGLDNAGDPDAVVDIIFADGARTTDSDGSDSIEDGIHTDNATVTVASAELSITKEVTIISEDTQGTFDCKTDPDPNIADALQGAVPGACLEYTITVTNGAAASVDADAITIADTLVSGISFEAFRLVTGWTNPAPDYDGPSREITAGVTSSITPGNSVVLSFRASVD